MCHYQPLLIVHYHRLTVIDHLAVGLIDAGIQAHGGARSCSSSFGPRLFLINKATSKYVNRFMDAAKQNERDKRIYRLSRICFEGERAMCTLRIIIVLNAALKPAHASHENYKALHEVY